VPYALSHRDWEQHLGPISYPKIIACPELIGLDAERFEQNVRWAHEIIAGDRSRVSPVLGGLGISPHAPYSLWAEGARALRHGNWLASLVMAMHVAESLDEREWLSSGTGAFRTAFEQLGVPLANDRLQIEEAIELLRAAQRSLLIHGNFLNAQELDRLAASRQVSVVACPRTHSHFGHAPYPLDAMLRRGINVVIGTDSRASNPDLNLWREMKAARCKHPELSATAALGAITIQAAQALGCDHELGTLEVGKLAYINVLRTERPVGAAQLLDFITAPDAANFSNGNAGDTEAAKGYPRPITWELVKSQ
jgi:cytosine/adenosine deaminase-related metal-dependent hydrolase